MDLDAEFKTDEDILDQCQIQVRKQLSQLAAVEETKLVDLDLQLGPTEQSAIHFVEKSWEVQDKRTLGGVFLVVEEKGVTGC